MASEIEYNQEAMKNHPDTKFIFGVQIYNMLKDEPFIKSNSERVFAIQHDLVQAGDNISCDLCSQITGSQNIVCVAVECAMYMGYKTIYLLGCDLSDTLNWEHFYADKDADARAATETIVIEDRICKMLVHKHHFAIARYAAKHGIKIYNLSNISTITAYERKTLQEVLACL